MSFKLKYCTNLFKLINFLDWEILHHRTQRFVAVDLLIFHILEGCPQVRKKIAVFRSLKQTCRYSWWAVLHRGGSRERVQGVPPPPLEMTCGFLIQLVFSKKKTTWFIGVEVEQEMSAPPPKKIPGSAPATWDHQGVVHFNLYQLALHTYNFVYVIFQDIYMHVGSLYKTTVCKRKWSQVFCSLAEIKMQHATSIA